MGRLRDALRRWLGLDGQAASVAQPTGDFMHLRVGRSYVVAKPFRDFDGHLWRPGEGGLFEGYNFLPYEDGLSLILTPNAGVRLQWRPEAQGEIIDNLADYLVEAPPTFASGPSSSPGSCCAPAGRSGSTTCGR